MSEHSHGFREERGCGSALREIYYTWRGSTWLIEGDIADCFGTLSHALLISTVSEKIHDGRFIHLVKKLLDAGYLEDWRFNQTLNGVPQGSIVSPILSNILLDKLNKYVETELVPQYNRGVKRKANQRYKNLMERARRKFKAGKKEAASKLRKQGQQLPSYDTQDPDYRRLKYIRYADDFCLAFIGPKSEAEEIKRQLRRFLSEELKLNLSEEKTLITHARSDAATLLGYEVLTLKKDRKHCLDKAGTDRRSINGLVGLRVPHAVILEKCDRYQKRGKPIQRAELLNESDFTIISTYQLEYRGIVDYYRLAYNLHSLDQLKWVMEQSVVKTLAHKHKTSVRKIYTQYRTEIEGEKQNYKVLQVSISREGKNPLVATWGGVPLIWDIQSNPDDRPQLRWNVRSELEKRLLAQVCEVCGATRMTAQIEVHHIRARKDLNKYEGREKPSWVKIMAARRRKTLILCHTCHMDLHAGRPLKQKLSRSRTHELPT